MRNLLLLSAGLCLGISGAEATYPLQEAPPAEGPESSLIQHFGFGDMQIYKFDRATGQLRIADLNNDGRNDILLWNGYKSRFELLMQAQPANNDPGAAVQREQNETPDRGPLRRKSLPAAYNVAAAELAELTGDRNLDIVFFGEPRELVILPGRGDGTFAAPLATRVPEAGPRSAGLAVGDFNHDGRSDVTLLSDDALLLFHQLPAGGLATPERIQHTLTNPLILVRGDLNADGRDDLLISVDDEQYGMSVFLQDRSSRIGPMQRVKLPKIRSLTVADLRPAVLANAPAASPATGCDILAVQQVSGRLMRYRWGVSAATGAQSEWLQEVHPFSVIGSKGKRQPFAIGDLTGDGRPDCVTATAEGAQLILVSDAATGLSPARTFPGMLKSSDLQVVDFDGDGRNELLSVSPEEKLIGLSAFENDRIAFPAPLVTRGKPLAASVGALTPGSRAETLSYVTRLDSTIRIVLRSTHAADEEQATVLDAPALNDDPAGIRWADVDGDGRNDVLLFVRFGGLVTFLQSAPGEFKLLAGPETREGLVRDAPLESAAWFDITGDGRPELLLCQKTFARALQVQDGRWTVVEQLNPDRTDAELGGLVVLPPQGDAQRPRVALYDRKTRDLLILSAEVDRAYEVNRRVSVGALELIGAGFLPSVEGAAARLVLGDSSKLVCITPDAPPPTLMEHGGFESDVREAYLADAVAGDLNHDGVSEIAVLDTGKANIDLLTLAGPDRMQRVLRFQVFQGKRFFDAPESGGEPHEAQVADVTGDGVDDLLLLVHDRLLIYPGM